MGDDNKTAMAEKDFDFGAYKYVYSLKVKTKRIRKIESEESSKPSFRAGGSVLLSKGV